MSALLRAHGEDFDVDAFVAASRLKVCAVWRRGEPVFAALQPNGRKHQRSGVNVLASDADFNDFPRQVEEALGFLLDRADEVRRLCAWPGVEGAYIDFGVERRDVAVQCDHLPPDLIRAAGLLGLGIELSQYPARSRTAAAEPSVAPDRRPL